MYQTINYDSIDFTCKAEFLALLNSYKNASHEEADSDQHGIIVRTQSDQAYWRGIVQALRREFKSELRKYPEAKCSVTNVFVPTVFDEDGNDGEMWEGVSICIEYHEKPGLVYLVIDMENAKVYENPYNRSVVPRQYPPLTKFRS
jgi:hypothetical protein